MKIGVRRSRCRPLLNELQLNRYGNFLKREEGQNYFARLQLSHRLIECLDLLANLRIDFFQRHGSQCGSDATVQEYDASDLDDCVMVPDPFPIYEIFAGHPVAVDGGVGIQLVDGVEEVALAPVGRDGEVPR